MESPLEVILGGRTAAMVMLALYHYGEVYPSGVARDLDLTQSAVQRQLERFESAGILVSKLTGKTRVYRFNPKHPATGRMKELVGVFYEGMALEERAELFSVRRRPRQKGKPVIGE
jgi:DNA-binding transcriptional ArsR family regulator